MQSHMIGTVERMDMVVRERKWQHLTRILYHETETRRECWGKVQGQRNSRCKSKGRMSKGWKDDAEDIVGA